MKKNVLAGIIFASVLCASFFLFGSLTNPMPNTLYHVYADGKTIGHIKDKQELMDLINREQVEIKREYNVDHVFLPSGVNIQPHRTFRSDVIDASEAYYEIKRIRPFTIEGYTVIIRDEDGEDIRIQVLDREVFNEAIENATGSFLNQTMYQAFINDEQLPIETTGRMYENVYLDGRITIRRDLISTDTEIFKDVDTLSKYLLFGTTEEAEQYRVEAGDNIESIAYNNRLGVGEFMIANPEFTSPYNLLYPGQMVNVGLIDPLVQVVVEEHVVSDKEQRYTTEVRTDPNLPIGNERVLQEGVDGVVRVTEKIRRVNGQIYSTVTTNQTVLEPAVNRIVVRGGMYIPGRGTGTWVWPTITPSTLSSPFGWRWGRLHAGIDISGTGHGSPIFASDGGTVIAARWWGGYGQLIIIDHGNGFSSFYAHLSRMDVRVGQRVSQGQVIGGKGSTGQSTGTHLHFEIRRGVGMTGTPINPLPLLRR